MVKRIAMDIAAYSVEGVRMFYTEVFDLKNAMDLGWIVALSSGVTAPVQVSVATVGG